MLVEELYDQANRLRAWVNIQGVDQSTGSRGIIYTDIQSSEGTMPMDILIVQRRFQGFHCPVRDVEKVFVEVTQEGLALPSSEREAIIGRDPRAFASPSCYSALHSNLLTNFPFFQIVFGHGYLIEAAGIVRQTGFVDNRQVDQVRAHPLQIGGQMIIGAGKAALHGCTGDDVQSSHSKQNDESSCHHHVRLGR